MSLPYEREKVALARKLRREMTRAERRLWYDGLRGCGVRFQRQKAIGVHIVDFYCHRARLAVEVDGAGHFTAEGRVRDGRRDECLLEMGVDVMRFENREVEAGVGWVVERILERVRTRCGGGGCGNPDVSPTRSATGSPLGEGALLAGAEVCERELK